MVETQVITASPLGSLSGLLRKSGRGVDLMAFGRADIQRSSIIEWDVMEQAWCVRILVGVGSVILNRPLWNEVVNGPIPASCHASVEPSALDVLFFIGYDEAVKGEVQFLDAARIAGYTVRGT